jgi:hypothetical protein
MNYSQSSETPEFASCLIASKEFVVFDNINFGIQIEKKKKTFYLQFCMGTPVGHQKSIFSTSKL